MANINDNGGVLNGTVMEPHEFRSGTAHSSLVGQCIGHSVHFAKTYNGAGAEYRETVLYFGTVCDAGEVITGEWQIEDWRGSFEMVREFSVDTSVEEKAHVEAGLTL